VGFAPSSTTSAALHQYHLIHDVYVMLDDGDRRVLRGFGITLAQYRVLKSLDLEEGQRLTTLSEALLRAKSTITRIVDQLEKDGLVRRTSDEDDRRAQRVVLTPAGARLLDKAGRAHAENVARRFQNALPPADREAFHRLLQELHDGLVADLQATRRNDA
jgi:MarR family 2-MHQ and catechol resistance regulon transcriptional repressor